MVPVYRGNWRTSSPELASIWLWVIQLANLGGEVLLCVHNHMQSCYHATEHGVCPTRLGGAGVGDDDLPQTLDHQNERETDACGSFLSETGGRGGGEAENHPSVAACRDSGRLSRCVSLGVLSFQCRTSILCRSGDH